MQFRLIYEGALPAASSGNLRKKEKHAIRKFLHPQMKELWATHPQLDDRNAQDSQYLSSREGFRWLPLVRKDWGMDCALDITFLRRDMPGSLVSKGGDIDNRIKVFLDALRIAEDRSDIEGLVPAHGEDPFFCLLQDDYLITELNITVDRLLKPMVNPETDKHHVVLIVNVRVGMPWSTMFTL